MISIAALLATPAASFASHYNCGEPLIIGVRGSGEPTGFGTVVQSAVNGLISEYSGETDAVWLDYPAESVSALVQVWRKDAYAVSIREGIDNLKLLLRTRAISCPEQKIVLFGYSQGALVVNQAIQELEVAQSALNDRLVAVRLFADPARLGQSAVNTGDASKKLNGVAVAAKVVPKRDFPALLIGRVESFCADGDPICAFKPNAVTDRGDIIHTGFYTNSGVAYRTGQQVGDLLRPADVVVPSGGPVDPLRTTGPAFFSTSVTTRVGCPSASTAGTPRWLARLNEVGVQSASLASGPGPHKASLGMYRTTAGTEIVNLACVEGADPYSGRITMTFEPFMLTAITDRPTLLAPAQAYPGETVSLRIKFPSQVDFPLSYALPLLEGTPPTFTGNAPDQVALDGAWTGKFTIPLDKQPGIYNLSAQAFYYAPDRPGEIWRWSSTPADVKIEIL